MNDLKTYKILYILKIILKKESPSSPMSAIKPTKEFIEVDSCQQSSTNETIWGKIVNFFKKVYDFLFGWIKRT
jgi:hypothetical protein